MAKIDLKTFVKTYGEIHASGGTVSDVAETVGMSPSKVSQTSGKLRKMGVNMPRFRRGQKTVELTADAISELNALL